MSTPPEMRAQAAIARAEGERLLRRHQGMQERANAVRADAVRALRNAHQLEAAADMAEQAS